MGKSISLRAALSETLLILRANPIPATIVFLLNAVLDLAMSPLTSSLGHYLVGMMTVFITVSALLLSIWIMPGMHLIALRAASGEAWDAGLMFAGGRWIGRFLGIGLVSSIPLTIIVAASLYIPYYAPIALSFLQQTESDSSWAEGDFGQEEIQNPATATYSLRSLIMDGGLILLHPAVLAAFAFSRYLAIDKNMGVSKAIEHGFELVRSIYPKVLIWHILMHAPQYLLQDIPGVAYWSWLLSGSLMVISTFVLAILYRERLRRWEAEAGQPLRHESMLSLPHEPRDETGLPENLSGA